MNNTAQHLSINQLLSVLALTSSAFAIHVFEDAVIEFANDAMITIWGKDKSVIGKSLEEALPELKGQPFVDMFKRVWKEGITISGKDTPAQLKVEGDLQTFYFDFEYRAIKTEEGETYCILHTATDVTERVLSARREQNLTNELKAANEELSLANNALYTTNKELNESQIRLQQLYEDLAESDARFRSMVKQAPVGICIINTDNLFIQDVNDSYLELVGKERSEFANRTIWQAVPEAADAYAPIMNNVIQTGIRFTAKEHELVLFRKGVPETVFVDFVYEPMKQDDAVVAILVLAIEVSDKVIARRGIEEMEERMRLALEAAEIGTFDLNMNSDTMLTSERFNAIFGFDRNISREEFAAAIHPDDNPKRLAAHKESTKTGKIYYEARVIHKDNSIKWVRVQGNLNYDKNGKPVRMLGTALDITQSKLLQQQKDDFISIASHELKTPITSLKASLQLLERIKDKPSEAMLPKLILQSRKSIQKVSTLIEDLLNVSRLQQGTLELNKTTFIISELLNACCNPISLAGKHKITITGDKELEVFADEHRIDQVIVNLINNAVKYAPESENILLSIQQENSMVKVSIKDNGPGISTDKIPYLFDRYYRIDPAGKFTSGLGLGLYICSEIIKRHDGEIGVESEPGKGSTFWFTLPIRDEGGNAETGFF